MKKIILICLMLLAMPAYSSSKQEKVNEILRLTNTPKALEASIKTAIVPLTCAFVLTPEEEKDLEREFKEAGDFTSLINASAQFWVDNYTEQELDELVAFYNTKTGKKLAELQPKQSQYTIQELQKWSQSIQPAVMSLAQKYSSQYRQRSGNEIQSCIMSKTGR